MRKSQENCKNKCRNSLVPSLHSINENKVIAKENWTKSGIKLSIKVLLYLLLTLVSTYFGKDCLRNYFSLHKSTKTPCNLQFQQFSTSLKPFSLLQHSEKRRWNKWLYFISPPPPPKKSLVLFFIFKYSNKMWH